MDKNKWPKYIYDDRGKFRIRIRTGSEKKTLYDKVLVDTRTNRVKDLRIAINHTREQLLRLNLGADLKQLDEMTTGMIRFSDAAEIYVNQHIDRLQRKTKKQHQADLEHFLVPHFGKMLVADITTEHLDEFLKQRSVSKKRNQNMMGVFNRLCSTVCRYNKSQLATNGLFQNEDNSKRLRVNAQAKQNISLNKVWLPEQVQAIIDELPQPTNQNKTSSIYAPAAADQVQLYFVLFVGLGLRPQEILPLRWTDWSDDETHINIDRCVSDREILEGVGKTERALRDVYVPEGVRRFLRESTTRFANGYIFVNQYNEPCVDTQYFDKAYHKARRRLRLPHKPPYSFRHTRASELLSRGVNPAWAAEQMGHDTGTFLNVYAKFIKKYQKQNLEMLESDHNIVKKVVSAECPQKAPKITKLQ